MAPDVTRAGLGPQEGERPSEMTGIRMEISLTRYCTTERGNADQP
jgi:hypothetical protein